MNFIRASHFIGEGTSVELTEAKAENLILKQKVKSLFDNNRDRQNKIDRLENILRAIKNSVAMATWNTDPRFHEWAKQVKTVIEEAETK